MTTFLEALHDPDLVATALRRYLNETPFPGCFKQRYWEDFQKMLACLRVGDEIGAQVYRAPWVGSWPAKMISHET